STAEQQLGQWADGRRARDSGARQKPVARQARIRQRERRMAEDGIEIKFGIGSALIDGKSETVVVVDDQVARLAEIVARHSTPGAVAPLMRELLPDWDRWQSWLRRLELQPSRADGWQPLDAIKFLPPVQEPWNIFHLYHNFER